MASAETNTNTRPRPTDTDSDSKVRVSSVSVSGSSSNNTVTATGVTGSNDENSRSRPGMASNHGNRFAQLDESDLEEIIKAKNSVKTHQVTSFAIKVLQEYLVQRLDYNKDNVCTCLQTMHATTLAEILRKFYAEVRTQSGEVYSKASLLTIRFGINRYFAEPPLKRAFDIIKDPQFVAANEMFMAACKEVQRAGKGTTQHKPIISKSDIKKLGEYFNDVLTDPNPEKLLHKVWFDIMIHFCRRGREGQRELTLANFAVKVGPDGLKYVEQILSEVSKNYQGMDKPGDESSGGVMSESRTALCPVKSFEMYVEKRNKECNAFFQRPLPAVTIEQKWFYNSPLGKNTLQVLMSKISAKAGLSQCYTNHSVRATSITVLAEANYDTRHIMSVSKHKSEASVRSYSRDATCEQKLRMSSVLSSTLEAQKEPVMLAPPTTVSENPLPELLIEDQDLDNLIRDLPQQWWLEPVDVRHGPATVEAAPRAITHSHSALQQTAQEQQPTTARIPLQNVQMPQLSPWVPTVYTQDVKFPVPFSSPGLRTAENFFYGCTVNMVQRCSPPQKKMKRIRRPVIEDSDSD